MKALKVLALMVVVAFVVASPAMAADETHPPPAETTVKAKVPQSAFLAGASVGAGLGAGLVLIGAGWGFGRIGAAALDGMARQPEVAGRIQTAMIVIAALLEGATFFALIVCILVWTSNSAGF
jgi:F-type H+-transporting ATPase subunit c